MDLKIGSSFAMPDLLDRGDAGVSSVGGGDGFKAYLERSMASVNELLQVADTKSTQVALGKSESLHEAMVAGEKAETAFKLMVQLRAKALEAYQEIIRMQV